MFVYKWFSIVSSVFVVQSLIIDSRMDDQSNRDFSSLEMVKDEIPLEVIQQVLENVTNFYDRNSYKTDDNQEHDPNTQSLLSILNHLMNNNNGAVVDDDTNNATDDDDDNDDESTFRSENIEKARWAKCEPELKAVKCNPNPLYLQLPSCIRLKQCGGCCMHSKLECKPTNVRTRLFEVHQYRYIGNEQWSNPIKELIKLDEHLACKCLCKISATDCSPLQTYNQTKCRCECRRDSDDRAKCLQRENAKRFVWDEQTCECRCRNYVKECSGSSTAYFDTTRCECIRSRTNPKRLAKPNNYSNLTTVNNKDIRSSTALSPHKYFYNTNSSSSGDSNITDY